MCFSQAGRRFRDVRVDAAAALSTVSCTRDHGGCQASQAGEARHGARDARNSLQLNFLGVSRKYENILCDLELESNKS